MEFADRRAPIRFGPFELNVGGYELRRQGRTLRLERQPMDLLILLVSRPRQLISRAEIIERLWGGDAFVDVEAGLNTAIRKIRQVLRDSARAPTFIETIAGKGYRFIADVELARAGEVDSEITLIAVLPFVNLSGNSERDYLADGLMEDTIASLSQLDPDHLCVIGRTSAMAYKRSRKSIATIGRELGARFLVEGSIRGAGNALRIHCTLNRAKDQIQLWSHSYEAQVATLPNIQPDLTSAIAEQIRLRLSPQRLDAAVRRHTPHAAAYDLYLRGRRFWNQLTPATTHMAVDYYVRATEIDPDYALAWAGLAEAFAGAPINGDAEPLAMWPRARDAAAQAIRANDALAETQHVWGQVKWFFEWDFRAADEAFRKAVTLDPSSAWAHSMFGHALSQLGRHEEARVVMERARMLEPLSPLHHAMSSQVAFQARDMPAAADHARRAIAIDPELWVGHMMRGQACEQLGEVDLALDALATAARFSNGNSKPLALRGYVLARVGRTDAAREMLDVLREASRNRYVPPYALALVYAGLQEDDRMFDCLEHALAARDVHLVFLPVDPKWDSFRTEPRFVSLLQRGGLATPPTRNPADRQPR